MSVLFRYLLQHYMSGMLKVTGLTVALVLLIDGIGNIRRFSYRETFNWPDVLLLVVNRIPGFVALLLPPILLLVTLLVVTRLSRQNEITVMRASGISIPRILWPFLAGGLLVSGVQFFLENTVVPHTSQVVRNLKARLMTNPARGDNVGIWRREAGRIIHVQKSAQGGQLLLGVTIDRFAANGGLLERLKARSARFRDGAWRLMTGTRFRFKPILTTHRFANRPWATKLQPDRFRRIDAEEAPQSLSLQALTERAAALHQHGQENTRFQVFRHSRMASPATILAAVLLAFPFALRLPRQAGATRSLIAGLLIGFAMFVVRDLATALGLGNRLSPVMAAWMPVLFFAGTGLFLLLQKVGPQRQG